MGVFCVRKRGSLSMTHGSHANVERAGFVRTPPTIAQHCRQLVTLPDHDLFSIGDLTCGKGDFLLPFVQPNAHMIGTELSRDRAARATELLPDAAIYATAIEHMHLPLECLGLVVANPPYLRAVLQKVRRRSNDGLVFLVQLRQLLQTRWKQGPSD